MIIEGFDVECRIGDRRVYSMKTVFGFFPPDAFDDQIGLPIGDVHRDQLALGRTGTGSISPLRPDRYCAGELRLPGPTCC